MSNATPTPKLSELDPAAPHPNVESTPVTDAALELWGQAVELERLLPVLMRQIFTTDPDHPTTDMPFGQFRLCVLLHSNGPRTMSHIGDDLGISVSAVTQMADRLEKGGIVERQTSAEGDKRVRTLCLSAYGLELMDSRMAYRLHRAHETLHCLEVSERASVLALLERLREVSRSPHPLPERTPGD